MLRSSAAKGEGGPIRPPLTSRGKEVAMTELSRLIFGADKKCQAVREQTPAQRQRHYERRKAVLEEALKKVDEKDRNVVVGLVGYYNSLIKRAGKASE